MQGTVKGGRRHGRQRKRWEDNIKDWTGLEFAKSQRTVENKEKMEKTGCKIICGAQTTLAVKELMMMMIIYFSVMLCKAKEDLPDGIYIRFRTDISVLNLRRLIARTNTIEELITELLFATTCALLARRKLYSTLATTSLMQPSLKRTEALYQPPTREAYKLRHISIDDTNLNAVEHFTYVESFISSDATVSRDHDNR